jgi:hypothetical protein
MELGGERRVDGAGILEDVRHGAGAEFTESPIDRSPLWGAFFAVPLARPTGVR